MRLTRLRWSTAAFGGMCFAIRPGMKNRGLWVGVCLAALTGCEPGGEASDAVTDEAFAVERSTGGGVHAAPARDEIIYFVMPDRFENGEPDNDHGDYEAPPDAPVEQQRLIDGFDPTDEGFYHGGDLVGLTDRLGYIKGLGATAIWTTPIMRNKPVDYVTEDLPLAAHHGFWVTDFLSVDPHLGTLDDLRAYVDSAQAFGFKVIFDILLNHTANTARYAECDGLGCGYVALDAAPFSTVDRDSGERVEFSVDDYTYAWRDGAAFPPLDAESFPLTPVVEADYVGAKHPEWLNDPTLYHNRGDLDEGNAESMLYGDLHHLDDLFSLHPTVLGGMVDIYRYWVDELGIDGYRLDAARHVPFEFLEQWWPEVEHAAHERGRSDFFAFGEVFDPSPAALSPFVKEGTLPAVLDFGFQAATEAVLARGAPTDVLAAMFANDDYYLDADSSAYTLPTFLGNHDMGRFGAFLVRDNRDADGDELLARARLAHALMLTSRGIPVIYYGDEQGFTGIRGAAETSFERSRQDMFPGLAPPYGDAEENRQLGTDAMPTDDNFDRRHPLYRAIRRFTWLRKRTPALRQGAQLARYSSDEPGGMFVFSRILRHQNREHVVAVNTHPTEERDVVIETLHPWTPFVLRSPFRPWKWTWSDGRGRLRVSAPPMDLRVYEALLPMPPRRRAPRVEIVSPAGGFGDDNFWVEAALSRSDFAEVSFYAHVPGEPSPRYLGTDDNSPYRVRFDAGDLPVGAAVEFTAVAEDASGNQSESPPFHVVIERRLLPVTVHYENANGRTSLFEIRANGAVGVPVPVDADGYTFDWPEGEDSLLLVFETPLPDGRVAFDLPVRIERDRDVFDNGVLTPDGVRAEVFIASDGSIAATSDAYGGPARPELPFDVDAANPIASPMFVKGSMNGWAAVDELEYVGGYAFAGVTTFSAAGDYQFKFADEDWSVYNFGTPFADSGLTWAGNSGNIPATIAEAGTYDVRLFEFPATDKTPALRLYRLAPAP